MNVPEGRAHSLLCLLLTNTDMHKPRVGRDPAVLISARGLWRSSVSGRCWERRARWRFGLALSCRPRGCTRLGIVREKRRFPAGILPAVAAALTRMRLGAIVMAHCFACGPRSWLRAQAMRRDRSPTAPTAVRQGYVQVSLDTRPGINVSSRGMMVCDTGSRHPRNAFVLLWKVQAVMRTRAGRTR